MNSKKKQKGLGIESKVKNMDPKLKGLYLNILSIMMIVMIVYGVLTFILTFMESNNFLSWFNTSQFTTTVISLVFLGFATKILKGSKIIIPEQQQQKTTFHIPDTYGVRGKGLGLGGKQPQKFNYLGEKPQQSSGTKLGSWKCPKCGSTVVGNQCKKCGYQRV